jgi:hypothetical protein
MSKCPKCEENADSPCIRTSGGNNFVFCKYCDKFLDDHPGITVRDYLGPKFEKKVTENIRLAHKKRMKGESPWNFNSMKSFLDGFKS